MGESMAELAIELGLDEVMAPDHQLWENSHYNYEDSLGYQVLSGNDDEIGKTHKRLHKEYNGAILKNTKVTKKTMLKMFGHATMDKYGNYGWDIDFKVINITNGEGEDDFKCYICESDQYVFSITYRKALPDKYGNISKKRQARVKFLGYV